MTQLKREILISGSIPLSVDLDDTTAKFVPKITAWFDSLSPEPVIKWNCASLSEDHPIGSNFVDVEVPPLLHELEVGWIWTIRPPNEDEPPAALEVVLDYDVEGGWTPLHMSDALSRWVAHNAGRDDVHFVWDPSIFSISYWLLEEAEDVSEMDMIEIGEGVAATPHVMDALLEMPWDAAAQITGTMQEVRDRHVSDLEANPEMP